MYNSGYLLSYESVYPPSLSLPKQVRDRLSKGRDEAVVT